MSDIVASTHSIFKGRVEFVRFELRDGDRQLSSVVVKHREFIMEHLQKFIKEKRKFVMRVVALMERSTGESQLLYVQSGPSDFIDGFLEQHAKILDMRLIKRDVEWKPLMLVECGFDCILPNSS